MLAAGALTLALAACGGEPAQPEATAPGAAAEVPTTAGDGPVPAEAIDYGSGVVESQWDCDGQRVAARFDNTAGTVTLTHERGELVLPQATSASGARYADANGNELWNKGNEASLTLSGRDAVQCQQVVAD